MKDHDKDLPVISIIIPVYNVANYLERCLEAILRQTYHNLEVILVDDGSTDGSPGICDQYAAEYENFTVIHQKNAGLSAARNAGTDICKGAYIAYIDSDDCVSDDYIEYLYNLCRKYDTKISVCSRLAFFDKINVPTTTENKTFILGTEEALTEIYYGKICHVSACAKLYRSEIAKKHRYPEGKLFEDQATTYKMIGEADAVSFGTKKNYYYFQRVESITHQTPTAAHLYALEAIQEAMRYANKRGFAKAIPAMNASYEKRCVDFAAQCLGGSAEEREMFSFLQKKMKPYWQGCMKDVRVSVALKVRSSAMLVGYGFAKFVFRTMLKIQSLRYHDPSYGSV